MPKPEYVICLECESEAEDFTWRNGEITRAVCEVCGNSDPDAFSLPEDYEQGFEDDDDEDEGDEEEYLDDYEDDEEEEES